MKIKKEQVFLFVLLLVSFLLRFPSLFEPYWYGDEGIYQVIGRAIRAGGLLYQDIWDNKPPLLYLIYAAVNGDQFLARLSSLVFLILSVVAFYFLSKNLLKKTLPIFISTAIFAILFSLPLLEGNIANAENFMLLPIIIAALLVINYTLSPPGRKLRLYAKRYTLFLAGFLLSLAFLLKIVAIFDLAAFFLFLFFIYQWKKKKYINQIKQFSLRVFPMVLGFSLPIVIVSLFFFAKGILADFLTATFSQNVNYVDVGNKLLISQGLLIFKLLLLAGFISLLYRMRSRLTKPQLFMMLWLATALFNAFFAGRPYTHYLLVLLPSFSLIIGAIFETKKYRLVNLFLILFVLALIPGSFWIYGKTAFYYQNFLSFVLGKQSVFSYQNFFDPNVERDYLLAQFLRGRTRSGENIFIWGDSPQIYALVDKLPPGRFIVAYHIAFYKNAVFETREVLRQKEPKYIVVLKEISPYEEFFRGYRLTFIVAGVPIYARDAFSPQE